jgi:hypothetical protein
VSIGFLVVALIAGGITQSNRLADLIPATPAEATVPAPPPRSNLDSVALKVLDSAAQISENARLSTDGLTPFAFVEDVAITHYGESFNGNMMGCGGAHYSSDNGGIVAVGAERSQQWPCGTVLRVCGPGGCMIGVRQDSCPGCDAYHLDLSEEGLSLVCGPGSGVCRASVEAYTSTCDPDGALVSDVAGVQDDGGMRLFAKLAEAALQDRTASLLDLASKESSQTGVCTAQAR